MSFDADGNVVRYKALHEPSWRNGLEVQSPMCIWCCSLND